VLLSLTLFLVLVPRLPSGRGATVGHEVLTSMGQGVSTVVKASDLKAGPSDRKEVATSKIIRSNETHVRGLGHPAYS